VAVGAGVIHGAVHAVSETLPHVDHRRIARRDHDVYLPRIDPLALFEHAGRPRDRCFHHHRQFRVGLVEEQREPLIALASAEWLRIADVIQPGQVVCMGAVHEEIIASRDEQHLCPELALLRIARGEQRLVAEVGVGREAGKRLKAGLAKHCKAGGLHPLPRGVARMPSISRSSRIVTMANPRLNGMIFPTMNTSADFTCRMSRRNSPLPLPRTATR
jgi:hypothetical protein